MQSGRLRYIDYSRGLAIISVLCIHIIAQMDIQFHQNNNIFSTIMMTIAYIPMFFIISGLLCTKTVSNKSNTLRYCASKFFNQSLLPFISLSLLFLIMHLIGSLYSNKFKNIYTMLTALSTLNISEDLPSGVLWYLFTLYLFSMTILFWERVLKGNMIGLILIAIILKAISPLLSEINLISINQYTINLCYYVFGYYILNNILSIDWRFRDLCFCIAVYFFAIYCKVYFWKNASFFLVVSSFVGPLSVLIIFRRLEIFYNKLPLRTIEFIGINSLLIYVFHMPSYTFITPILYGMGLQNSYIGFAFMLIMGVICPLIIGEILSFFPQVYESIFFRSPSITFRQAFFLRINS